MFGLSAKAQLVFSRAIDLTMNVNALLKIAMAVGGGGTGGTSALTRAGMPQAARLDEALAVAYRQLAQK